jgi:bacterioferritin-associated ferredoxin
MRRRYQAGIEQAVANGARTLEDVESATGAGTRCGRCTEAVEACLQEALAAQAS